MLNINKTVDVLKTDEVVVKINIWEEKEIYVSQCIFYSCEGNTAVATYLFFPHIV